jgi:hypothetical protein
MNRSRVSIVSALVGLVAVILQGCGGAEDAYLNEDDWAEVVVLISSTNSPLVPNQRNTVLIRVVNAGKNAAVDVVLQFPAPIGFQYDSVNCQSAGTVRCPPVTVQQVAGGVIVPSFPPSSELALVFEGVTTGDVGTQVAITGAAKADWEYWDKDLNNNSALLYVPIVAPAASPVSDQAAAARFVDRAR